MLAATGIGKKVAFSELFLLKILPIDLLNSHEFRGVIVENVFKLGVIQSARKDALDLDCRMVER